MRKLPSIMAHLVNKLIITHLHGRIIRRGHDIKYLFALSHTKKYTSASEERHCYAPPYSPLPPPSLPLPSRNQQVAYGKICGISFNWFDRFSFHSIVPWCVLPPWDVMFSTGDWWINAWAIGGCVVMYDMLCSSNFAVFCPVMNVQPVIGYERVLLSP